MLAMVDVALCRAMSSGSVKSASIQTGADERDASASSEASSGVADNEEVVFVVFEGVVVFVIGIGKLRSVIVGLVEVEAVGVEGVVVLGDGMCFARSSGR